MSIQEFLQDNDACIPAKSWAKGKSLQKIWERCNRGEWLVWLLRELGFSVRTFKELAIMFAESVTHLMRDERSKQSVIDLRRWLNGEQVDLIMVRQSAADAANEARYNSDLDYATRAAFAAYTAADYATTAFDLDGLYNTISNAYAAYKDAIVGSSCADYPANLIRNHIPFNKVAQAAQKMGIDC